MSRRLALCAGLAIVVASPACNEVLGIDETVLSPDVARDQDGDSWLDSDDNCPEVANPAQSDDDLDGFGDACDNCPLVGNPEQGNDGDRDPPGDLCDPHPAHDGDCLILFDSFANPVTFGDHWMVVSSSMPAEVRPGAGTVVLAPTPGQSIEILARDSRGAALDGRFSIQLAANLTFMATGTRLAVVTGAATLAQGYRCLLGGFGAAFDPQLIAEVFTPTYNDTGIAALTSRPFGELATLRLVPELPDGSLALACRADLGVAVAFVSRASTTPPPAGGTGVLAVSQPVEIKGLEIYRFQPGAACDPAAIW